MDKKIKKLIDQSFEGEMIEANDIPNIELYMDQVTTFMEKHLSKSKRYPEDKIMTKTMINNYTKNQLLPPSTKKKYSKEHIFLLIMIYYYKSMLSISDIQNLLSPLTEKYFPGQKDSSLDIETIYTSLMNQVSENGDNTKAQILETYRLSEELAASYPVGEDEKKELLMFNFISHLCCDIYARKQLIERLIDDMYPPKGQTKKDKKSKK